MFRMSYEIVKSVTVKGGKVFVNSAPNNVSPLTFSKWECPAFSEAYVQYGNLGLLTAIAKEAWTGNFKLRAGAKFNDAVLKAFAYLEPNHSDLRHFLDKGCGASLIGGIAYQYMISHSYTLQSYKAIQFYESLRKDVSSVLDVCKNNPAAFHYADESIQKDREAAKFYIEQCAGQLGFQMPPYFCNDITLATAALQKDGLQYRLLSESLRADPEIISLAFNASCPGREHYEFSLGLVPEPCKEDPAIVQNIISICPKLHISNSTQVLENRDTAKAFVQNSAWMPGYAFYLPARYLAESEFKNMLTSTCKTPEQMEELKSIYKLYDLSLEATEPTHTETKGSEDKGTINVTSKDLNSMIARAEARMQAQGKDAMSQLDKQITITEPEH